MVWIIQSSRIKVREVTMDDVKTFLNWWNDPQVMKDVGFEEGLKLTYDQVYEQFLKRTKQKSSKASKLWIVFDQDNHPIGEFSYGEHNDVERSCRIGLKICDVKAQGKGLGKHLLLQGMHYLFSTLDYHKIYIDTLTTNKRAIQLYQTIGAATLEVKKNFWTNPQNIVFDAIFFECLRENFYQYTLDNNIHI